MQLIHQNVVAHLEGSAIDDGNLEGLVQRSSSTNTTAWTGKMSARTPPAGSLASLSQPRQTLVMPLIGLIVAAKRSAS